jgi:3-phosphoshikimate 1-carboxyvinyltransferase
MLKIYPSVMNGTMVAPPSELFAQGLLCAASLPTSPTIIHNMPRGENIDAMIEGLEAFGCSFSWLSDSDLQVTPFVKTSPVLTASLNFRSSYTASRFLIPIAAAMGIKSSCRASDTVLRGRRISELTTRMAVKGVTFSNFSLPFEMKGRLAGGEFIFSGDEDPQYAASLMFALPMLREDSEIIFEKKIADTGVIAMVLSILHRFGIVIETTEKGYHIPGRQYYAAPKEVSVESDWALSDMLLMCGVFSASKGGKVSITGLDPDSFQMYRTPSAYFPLLAQRFKELNIDCEEFPDLSVIFTMAAALTGAKLSIKGVEAIKHEDVGRLSCLADCVRQLGGEITVTENTIDVQGKQGLDVEGIELDCKGDPWVFFAVCCCAPLLEKPLVVTDENGAGRFYRNFLADYAALGGKTEVI